MLIKEKVRKINRDRLMSLVKTVVYWYLHRKTRKIVFGVLMMVAAGFLSPSLGQMLLIFWANGFNTELVDTTLIVMLCIGVLFAFLAIFELVWLGPKFEKIANRHRNMIDAFRKYLSYCDRNEFVREMNLIQNRLYVTEEQYEMVRGWTELGGNVKGCFVKLEYEDKVTKFHKDIHEFNEFCGFELHDYKNNGCNHVIRDADFAQRKDKLLQLTDELKKDLNELHELFKNLDNKVLLAF